MVLVGEGVSGMWVGGFFKGGIGEGRGGVSARVYRDDRTLVLPLEYQNLFFFLENR